MKNLLKKLNRTKFNQNHHRCLINSKIQQEKNSKWKSIFLWKLSIFPWGGNSLIICWFYLNLFFFWQFSFNFELLRFWDSDFSNRIFRCVKELPSLEFFRNYEWTETTCWILKLILVFKSWSIRLKWQFN